MKIIFNWKTFLFVIILLAAFLRFYQLDSIPAGLTNDEVNKGYDAYSLYHTGRDQWGEFMPLISFKGFGDYRPPLYTYLIVPFIPLFGLTAFTIHFPAALFSLISIVLLFFILKKLFSVKVGLVGGLLFAISPWAIGLGRMGIESNIGVTILLAGILCFLYVSKKISYLYISILFFAGTLYAYAGYTLLTPLILVTLICFYHRYFIKQTKSVAIGIGLFIILCLPLFIRHDAAAKVRFSQINFIQNVTSIGIVNTLNNQRGECIKSYPSSVCKLAFNKGLTFGSTLITNYLSHFSINFLFIDGTETQYSILPQRGLLYIFEFFLLIAGLLSVVLRKKKEGYLILVLLLLSPIPNAITGSGDYSRDFVILPFLLCIEALGFIAILTSLRVSIIKTSFITLSVLIATGSLIMFFLSYTTYFRVFNSRFSSYGYEELMKQIYKEKDDYDKIYITKHLNDTKQYVYYLFYNAYDPASYQQKTNVTISEGKDGWINIEKIDNIYFVETLPKIDPKSDLAKEDVLLISTPVDFPEDVRGERYIRDLKNDALFELVPLNRYGNHNLLLNKK